jgi:hypothetical protein
MVKTAMTMKQFEAMTLAERQAMPLEQSSTLWSQIQARDMEEFTRLDQTSQSTTPTV